MIPCSTCEGRGTRYNDVGEQQRCLVCGGSGEAEAGSDPNHVEWLLDHIAHLDDKQILTIHNELNRWEKQRQDRENGETIEQIFHGVRDTPPYDDI